MQKVSWVIARFFDSLSLSGAIILLFFTLTVVGIAKNDEKIWQQFGTALTTFVSGKKLADIEKKEKEEKEGN
jgi:hypothetical protein